MVELSNEITGMLIDEATDLPYHSVTCPDTGIIMWYSDKFKEVLVNHPVFKTLATKYKVLTKEDVDSLNTNVALEIGNSMKDYLDRQIVLRLLNPPTEVKIDIKVHKQPFWTKDWRKRR